MCTKPPPLFNIYLSDLPNIFDNTCSPATLYDQQLNCLMFADDIVLISETSVGLQNALDKLDRYCKEWHLTININKTKIIIFNKGGHNIKLFKFFLSNLEIELAHSYTYLGITFSCAGTFTLALQHLHDKALKALHHFKQIDFRNNVKMSINLFDALNTPIIAYSCKAWASI